MPGPATGARELQRIVVAIKPWQRGLPLAAALARQLAKGASAQIRIVSTVFDAGVAVGRERGDAKAVTRGERVAEAARVELERLAQSLREWGASVTTRVVWDASAYGGILAAVRDWGPDLVVIGAHERRPPRTRLTDTDWQLMRHVSCPLLLVKDPVFDGYRTIVAAVDPLHGHADPSGLDDAVLAAGRSFARAFGSALRVVNASNGTAPAELATAGQAAPAALRGADALPEPNERAVTDLVERYGVSRSEVDLVAGEPAGAIVGTAAARRARLVVVGAPQRRGRLAAMVGSTTEAVVTEAPCDVLLVPVAVD